MTRPTGISLQRDGLLLADTPEDVNRILTGEGICVWPLDLDGVPTDIRHLLDSPTLTEDEARRARDHFLLPRERLLAFIAKAGREPHFPGGGALETYCVETEISYPQLHVISEGLDYSGFSPLHVNVGEDGSGSDEVGQVLSGRDMVYRFGLSDGSVVTLSMTCPHPQQGWLFTFDGAAPHGGILEDTAPGTKVLVQAIGPPRFHRRYV